MEQAPRLAEDLRQVSFRDVLAGVRAGDEVDGFGREAGRARVPWRQVADPEARLELLGRADRPAEAPQLPARLGVELLAEAAERRERVVHELDSDAWADVHEHLPPDAQRGIRKRDREVPAGTELVEARLRRGRPGPVLLVGLQVLERTGELAPEDRLARGQRAKHVSLEDVVQPLALG
jgi:hypothetical protein